MPTEYLDFFDSRNIRISVFYMRAQTELWYILQSRVEKGVVYFLWHIKLRAILFLTLGCLDHIEIFMIRVKLEFLYFTLERAYWVGVYTRKHSRIRHCIFFLTEYIQSDFLLTFGCLHIIWIFFDSRKIRISVFYLREHIELVYII